MANNSGDTAVAVPKDQPQNNDARNAAGSASGPNFSGFESDADFKRLLSRYPKLKYELQLVFGVTLEPGPDDAYTWNKQKWFDDGRDAQRGGRGAYRGAQRGRGRGRARGGFHDTNVIPPEDRIRGPWTQTKGDQQGLDLIKKMKHASNGELSEGMLEFVKLCTLRFHDQAFGWAVS